MQYLILLYISLFQIRIMIEPSKEQLQKLRWQKINRVFLMIDISFAAISLLVSFITIPNECSMSFFLFYTIYFMGQSIQHFLVLKMPKIDVVKYDITIKRYVYIASAIQILYFFVMFMFLVKTELHPIYCFLCIQLGISSLIGILLIAHFIVSLFMYIQFLYKYINRKYYLLALGGFEVEVRLNAQLEQNRRRVALIEPYYNEYPVINEEINKPSDKFFKFEDIKQDVEGEEVCSICLTREKEGFHPIYTPCRHYFHRECIENWAKINGKCPQCRASLEQNEADINAQLQENL